MIPPPDLTRSSRQNSLSDVTQTSPAIAFSASMGQTARFMMPTSNRPPVNYSDYLCVTSLLSCQKPLSPALHGAAHDEMLFISVHQVHELWMKQILFEIDSILDKFTQTYCDERDMGIVTHRLQRILRIIETMVDGLLILESMSPLDFLEFRDLLTPASGFQSLQFRLLEAKVGVRRSQRSAYGEKTLHTAFSSAHLETLRAAESSPSLRDRVQSWLERTPFLEKQELFWEGYREAFARKLAGDHDMLGGHRNKEAPRGAKDTFEIDALLQPNVHDRLVAEGRRSFSLTSLQAALFIHLYRDEPLFQQPYRFLNQLLDLDEALCQWRSQHIHLVSRAIGHRMGTGGSSGIPYLQDTVDRHRVFSDLASLATYMIPRSALPPLPENLRGALGFRFPETGTR